MQDGAGAGGGAWKRMDDLDGGEERQGAPPATTGCVYRDAPAAHRPAGLRLAREVLASAGALAVQPAPGLSGAVQTWAVEGPSGRWFCR